VVLQLYREDGKEFVEKLRGMFALALWDNHKQELLLARDRLGIKPLFYTRQQGVFAFASELKALLAIPGLNLEIDEAAFFQYLNLLAVPFPHSIYQSCRKLEPGCLLTLRDGRASVNRYWDLDGIVSSQDRLSDPAEFSPRFDRVVKAHMVADVPVGAFLSGGLDSSFVCRLAAGHAHLPLQTFSAAFDDAAYDESETAALVAQSIGTRHTESRIQADLVSLLPKLAWHMDEPFGVISALPTFVLAREAARQVKVVLTGDGADEILGGYPWRHGRDVKTRRWDVLPRLMRRLADCISLGIDAAAPKRGPKSYIEMRRSLRYAGLSQGMCYSGFLRYVDDETLFAVLRREAWLRCRKAWRENRIAALYDRLEHGCVLTRRLVVDVLTSLVDEMLTKVDRTTMAHGLEARVPYLDHRWVEYCFALNPVLKVRGGQGKLILREAVRDHLPTGISEMPKHGFNVPVAEWFRGHLKEFLGDHLLSKRLLARGWFDRKRLIRIFDQHLKGLADYGLFLFALLAYALWEEAQSDIIRFAPPIIDE
jgi:asparagine synthase (glutamine-hydrolysing)